MRFSQSPAIVHQYLKMVNWFWAPSAAKDGSSTPKGGSNASSGPSPGPNSSARNDAATTKQSPARSLSRDEQAEVELQGFLAQINAETGGTLSSSSQQYTSSPSSISPDSLYPTTMSCRQAFDNAFYCQSMGGQFNNVYRYGGIKDCSEHWGAFWFCMRNKSYGDDEKARRIQDLYRSRAVKYKVGPSSEDVWEVRKEPLQDAFSQDPDALDV